MVVARRLLLVVVFAGLLWLGWRFAGANAGQITVDVLVARFHDVSLWLALIGSFAVGAIVAGLLVLLEVVRSNLRARRYRKMVSKLEAEIHQLRNLPLTQSDAPAESTPAVTGQASAETRAL